jgi:peptidoglycan-associated lipoprotein
MMRPGLRNFAVCAASTALVLMLACGSAILIATADAQDGASDQRTPAELLEDGMDAAGDHAMRSARELLGQLILDYPNSPEAARARQILATLDSYPDASEERAVIRANEAERTAKYRHAFLVDVGDRVFFSESSAALGTRARYVVDNQARWLKVRPDLTVTVIGRADDGGSPDFANELSKQRAAAVRERLIAAGIESARIKLDATGGKDLPAVCKTPLCHAENRNAEVLIDAWRYGNSRRPDQDGPAADRIGSNGKAVSSGVTDQAPQ